MKHIIIVVFLLGFFLINNKHLAQDESYVKVEPIKKVQSKSKRVYVPPTGQALTIANQIAEETQHPVEVISRIMWAESDYSPKAFHRNKNGTTDCGRMQINSSHKAKAQSMNIDICSEEGNTQFAIYLLKTKGLQPWGFSKHSWGT